MTFSEAPPVVWATGNTLLAGTFSAHWVDAIDTWRFSQLGKDSLFFGGRGVWMQRSVCVETCSACAHARACRNYHDYFGYFYCRYPFPEFMVSFCPHVSIWTLQKLFHKHWIVLVAGLQFLHSLLPSISSDSLQTITFNLDVYQCMLCRLLVFSEHGTQFQRRVIVIQCCAKVFSPVCTDSIGNAQLHSRVSDTVKMN